MLFAIIVVKVRIVVVVCAKEIAVISITTVVKFWVRVKKHFLLFI